MEVGTRARSNSNDGTASHKERCKRGAEKSNGLKTYNEECNSGIKQRKNLFTTESSLKANAYRIKNGLTEEHKEKIRIAALKREAAKRAKVEADRKVDKTGVQIPSSPPKS
jgi:hypothetical protein